MGQNPAEIGGVLSFLGRAFPPKNTGFPVLWETGHLHSFVPFNYRNMPRTMTRPNETFSDRICWIAMVIAVVTMGLLLMLFD